MTFLRFVTVVLAAPSLAAASTSAQGRLLQSSGTLTDVAPPGRGAGAGSISNVIDAGPDAVACGSAGETCCEPAVGEQRCDAGLTCQPDGTCRECGTKGNACCAAGLACGAGLACEVDGTCVTCGVLSKPCCGGTQCGTDLECVAAPPGAGPPFCIAPLWQCPQSVTAAADHVFDMHGYPEVNFSAYTEWKLEVDVDVEVHSTDPDEGSFEIFGDLFYQSGQGDVYAAVTLRKFTFASANGKVIEKLVGTEWADQDQYWRLRAFAVRLSATVTAGSRTYSDVCIAHYSANLLFVLPCCSVPENAPDEVHNLGMLPDYESHIVMLLTLRILHSHCTLTLRKILT